MSTGAKQLNQIMVSGAPSIKAVRKLEKKLLEFPQVDLHTSTLIDSGMCARTVFIPAGTALTGALTNIDNISIVFGDITVTTDEGPKRLTGFNVLPAKAGSKRVGVTNSDTWWTTLHCTDLTDIEAIENEMTSEAHNLQTRRPLLEMEN